MSGFSAGDCIVAALGNDPCWPAFLLAGWDRALVVAPIESDRPEAQLDRILELHAGSRIGPRRLRSSVSIVPRLCWEGPKPDLLKITSGTTGAPRAVRFRESQLLADCRNICDTMGIGPEDVNFGVIPILAFVRVQQPDHSPALSGNGPDLLNGSDATGGLSPSAELWSDVSFPARQPYSRRLDRSPDAGKPPGIRLCISAGAPLAPEISRQFHRRFGLKIHSFYGSSECGGIAYDRERGTRKTGRLCRHTHERS